MCRHRPIRAMLYMSCISSRIMMYYVTSCHVVTCRVRSCCRILCCFSSAGAVGLCVLASKCLRSALGLWLRLVFWLVSPLRHPPRAPKAGSSQASSSPPSARSRPAALTLKIVSTKTSLKPLPYKSISSIALIQFNSLKFSLHRSS